MKIFAIPYAVGNTNAYFQIKRILNRFVDFVPIELPGHGVRLNEPLLQSIEAMADDVVKQLLPKIDEDDYCLFGYSMGALICRDAYYKLKHCQCSLPKMVFLCACPAPGDIRQNHDILNCSRDDLIAILKSYGGTPEEVFTYESLLDIILPIAKADFYAVESYSTPSKEEKMLSMGVILYSDNEANDIMNWSKEFVNECIYRKIGKSHFFLHENCERLCEEIRHILS